MNTMYENEPNLFYMDFDENKYKIMNRWNNYWSVLGLYCWLLWYIYKGVDAISQNLGAFIERQRLQPSRGSSSSDYVSTWVDKIWDVDPPTTEPHRFCIIRLQLFQIFNHQIVRGHRHRNITIGDDSAHSSSITFQRRAGTCELV